MIRKPPPLIWWNTGLMLPFLLQIWRLYFNESVGQSPIAAESETVNEKPKSPGLDLGTGFGTNQSSIYLSFKGSDGALTTLGASEHSELLFPETSTQAVDCRRASASDIGTRWAFSASRWEAAGCPLTSMWIPSRHYETAAMCRPDKTVL